MRCIIVRRTEIMHLPRLARRTQSDLCPHLRYIVHANLNFFPSYQTCSQRACFWVLGMPVTVQKDPRIKAGRTSKVANPHPMMPKDEPGELMGKKSRMTTNDLRRHSRTPKVLAITSWRQKHKATKPLCPQLMTKQSIQRVKINLQILYTSLREWYMTLYLSNNSTPPTSSFLNMTPLQRILARMTPQTLGNPPNERPDCPITVSSPLGNPRHCLRIAVMSLKGSSRSRRSM